MTIANRLARNCLLPRLVRRQILRQQEKGRAKYGQVLTASISDYRRSRGVDDVLEETADMLVYIAGEQSIFLFLTALPFTWALALVRWRSPITAQHLKRS